MSNDKNSGILYYEIDRMKFIAATKKIMIYIYFILNFSSLYIFIQKVIETTHTNTYFSDIL